MSNRKYPDLEKTHPELCLDWDNENNPYSPSEFSQGSEKVVFWKCHVCSFKWKTSIYNRAKRKRGCLRCFRNLPFGENNLADQFPNLIGEWSPENNKGIYHYGPSSPAKVKWICPEGHKYETRIADRTVKGTGCPYCSGRFATKDYNLLTEHPDVCIDWDPTNEKPPSEYTPYSSSLVWWVCKKGHSSKIRVADKVKNPDRCAWCSNKKPSDRNNLGNEPLSIQFDLLENYPLKPENFTRGSHKKVWWKCENGHKWKTNIYNRTVNFNGCRKCAEQGTSRVEQEFYQWIVNNISSIAKNGYRPFKNSKKEIDIFIPNCNLGVEFNGLYWHSEIYRDKKYHKQKLEECRRHGFDLIFIYEDEWYNKQELVKSVISAKCNIFKTKIFARKCEIKEVNKQDRKDFFERCHLSGDVRSVKCLGLYYENKLVCALSLRKPFHKKYKDSIEIARFASDLNTNVVGGFSKLLKQAIKWSKENDYKNILSYSENRLSKGDVYQKNGFKFIHDTKFGFYYVDFGKIKRYDRFKFRAKDGKSEKQVTKENNVFRLYNCGQSLWDLEV